MSEGRGAETRQRLLEAAAVEFARYGYAGAHLQSIAEQVGVQKTALYYYFEGKAALYTAVISAMVEAFDEALARAVEAPGTYPERLGHLVDGFNDVLAANPHYARILTRIFVDAGGADYQAVGAIIRRAIGRVLSFFREGMDAGAFTRRSSRHFFLSLLGMSIFHYAAPEFGAAITGVKDSFEPDAVAWRRSEVKRLLFEGVLAGRGKE